jgi:hypothetical protein
VFYTSHIIQHIDQINANHDIGPRGVKTRAVAPLDGSEYKDKNGGDEEVKGRATWSGDNKNVVLTFTGGKHGTETITWAFEGTQLLVVLYRHKHSIIICYVYVCIIIYRHGQLVDPQ